VDVPLFSFAITEVKSEFRFISATAGTFELLFGCSAPRANCGGRLPG
jgi:hypothetical protein